MISSRPVTKSARSDRRRYCSRASRPSLIRGSAIRGEDVVRALERIVQHDWLSRQPFALTKASEFVSRDLDLWAYHPRRHARLLTAR